MKKLGYKLKNKTILLISPEPFSHIFVSKHHYAIHLAKKGNKVYFLNPPFTKHEVLITDYQNVFEVNYKGFVKGMRFFPNLLQKQLTKWVFNKLQELCSVRFDVVWSFDNSVFFRFDALPEKVMKISHIVDLNQNFQTKRAASKAHVCFGVSSQIVKRLSLFNDRTYFINHGFNLITNEVNVDLEFSQKIKPRCIYAGNLAMPYLDWQIIYTIVNENASINFIFIGPDYETLAPQPDQEKWKRTMCELKNFHLLGKLNNEVLQSYYRVADLLLISYQEKHHNDQSNPHKMMEYLGSGTMVVATHTAEYIDLEKEKLIQMSNSNAEFPSLFKGTTEDLNNWNSEEKKKARMAFALENTYDKQIQRIENYIEETLN